MLECKIRCLGPQRGRLPWTTQQMTNDGWSFALPITVKKYVPEDLNDHVNENNLKSLLFLEWFFFKQ